MSIPSQNIRKPANPIPKEGFPHNRVHQQVQGKLIKVGSVIQVGHTGPNDNWWSLSQSHSVRPWEIIWWNFQTHVPEEVNWYLQEYVGCQKLGPRGRNYRFEGASPGLILMPWGEEVNNKLLAETPRPKKEDDMLDKRWPERKADIDVGRQLVKTMLGQMHKEVVHWRPNAKDFDVAKEAKDKIFSPGGPKFGFGDLVEGVVKVFNEIHPEQQRTRKMRELIHDALARGVASVLFPRFKVSMKGRTGYERVFFEKGQKLARRWSKLQRYQFCLGLAENARHHGLGGFQPLPGTKYFYRSRIDAETVVRLIRQEFTRNKYLFRN